MRFLKSTSSALAGFFLCAQLFAQGVAADRYAPVYRDADKDSAAAEIAADFLTYPLEIVRRPVSKTLVFVEKHHIDTKIQWMYEQLINHGITPHFGFAGSGGGIYAGVDLDLVRVAELKGRYPDLKANSRITYSKDILFQVGSELGWHDSTGTGLGAMGIFTYEMRPEEHFYGIGPNTSRGEGTSFRMETTTLGTQLLYKPSPAFEGNLTFTYRNINIGQGGDGGRGVIERIFPAGSIPGLGGDEILSWGAEIIRDTRNHRELSTRGGLQRLAFSFNEGVAGSDARYFSYEAQAAHYFRLGSDRRVLAIHLHGIHHDGVNNGIVPFHQMAKLGGHGTRPRLSHTLRAYDFNRFFDESMALANIEYRYTILEYRDFKLDSVLFWDEGQVFGEFSKFKLKDFRESYGLGFRLSVANHLLLSVEGAHGSEGTNFYVKTRTPF